MTCILPFKLFRSFCSADRGSALFSDAGVWPTISRLDESSFPEDAFIVMDELQRDFYKLMMTVYLLTLQFMKKEKTIFYSSGRTASRTASCQQPSVASCRYLSSRMRFPSFYCSKIVFSNSTQGSSSPCALSATVRQISNVMSSFACFLLESLIK